MKRVLGGFAATVATVVMACMALALVGVPVTGFGFLTRDAQAAEVGPEPAEAYLVSSKTTTAGQAVDGIFDRLDAKWKASGDRIGAAGVPHPFTCASPFPVLSSSQSYNNKAQAQVTIAAYGPGLGAAAQNEQVKAKTDCLATPVGAFETGRPDLGVSAFQHQVNFAGNSLSTVSVRRGDIIFYVTTASSQGDAARDYAKAVDAELTALLDKCVQPKSKVADRNRNAVFAGKKFTGRLAEKVVEVDAAEQPEATDNQKVLGITDALPGKKLNTPDGIRPLRPGNYPLWPQLPKERSTPQAPKVPEPQKTSETVDVRVPDPDGPGCGWAFTSSAAAPYDADQAEVANTKRLDAAQFRLEDDAERWVKQVGAYYTKYHDYTEKVDSFLDYTKQLAEVADAWSAIEGQWNVYYTDYANWDFRRQSRESFVNDKRSAQTQYDDAIAECKNYPALVQKAKDDAAKKDAEAEEDTVETDEPEDPSGGETTPPPAPEVDLPPAPDCPPVKPQILSQKAPAVGDEPSTPPDPRP